MFINSYKVWVWAGCQKQVQKYLSLLLLCVLSSIIFRNNYNFYFSRVWSKIAIFPCLSLIINSSNLPNELKNFMKIISTWVIQSTFGNWWFIKALIWRRSSEIRGIYWRTTVFLIMLFALLLMLFRLSCPTF
jgi:hypothetical protein